MKYYVLHSLRIQTNNLNNKCNKITQYETCFLLFNLMFLVLTFNYINTIPNYYNIIIFLGKKIILI